MRYGELAEAYEGGDPTEVKWKLYRRNTARHIDADLIEAAYAQPALRMLFPYTSHFSLRLSRCTRWPFLTEIPVITPLPNAVYAVAWPARSPYGPGTIGSANTAQDAIALVIARLPDGYGPAVDATADELNEPPSTE